MHKLIVFTTVFLLGTTFAVAAPAQKAQKITKTRIVQASKDTTVSYGGMKVFVPAGQAVVLGQTADGAVVVRGQNLRDVRVGDATITANGFVVLSVQPQTNVITVNRGEDVHVTDANGRTAVLSQGASVDGTDIRQATASTLAAAPATQTTSAQTVSKTTATAQVTAEETSDALPSYVAATETSTAASEQAAQDVEETLSPSTPR